MKLLLKLSIFLALFGATSCGTLFGYSSSNATKADLDNAMAKIQGKYQNDDKGFYTQKVIEATGSKEELYLKLLEFFNMTYTDANEVIQVKEKEDGLIICKGCHRFKVGEIFWGSAIEQTVWHIFKAEIKENKVRITITIENIEYYKPAVTATVYIPSERGYYSLYDCPPYKTYKEEKDNIRMGYVFYHSISNIVSILQSAEKALLDKPRFSESDNW